MFFQIAAQLIEISYHVYEYMLFYKVINDCLWTKYTLQEIKVQLINKFKILLTAIIFFFVIYSINEVWANVSVHTAFSLIIFFISFLLAIKYHRLNDIKHKDKKKVIGKEILLKWTLCKSESNRQWIYLLDFNGHILQIYL